MTAVFAASGDLGNFSGYRQGTPDYERAINIVHDAAIKAGMRLCGPFAWRDRPDFTCFQAGSETAAIARGVAAELGTAGEHAGQAGSRTVRRAAQALTLIEWGIQTSSGESHMSGPLAIGSDAPDFQAQTTEGPISFHQWLGNAWGVIFSHPKDFTPVCTTELGYLARIKPEFDKRGVKVIGLSIDPVDRHAGWAKDIQETQGTAVNFPMIGDTDLKVAKLYGMLPAEAGETSEGRTAADNATVRNVYVINPAKKITLVISYPMSTGRNFDEVLRVIDSMQLTAKHKVSTPVNWKNGEDVIISGNVTEAEAKEKYPQGWQQPKPYIRIVPQPKG